MKKEKNAYTPMMMQYLQIKEKNPDTLILFRLGDFYELFFEDARIASKELQLTLTGKNAGAEEKVPMCGVPYHAIKGYIAKLISKGYRVGIVEQLEDPATAKGIVERDVIQIITPGAFMDLSKDDNNYICAVDETDYCYVLAYADLSTGEIYTMNVEKDFSSLLSELDSLTTKEIVLHPNFPKDVASALYEKRHWMISYEEEDEITLEFEEILEEIKDLYQMKAIMRLIYYFKKTQKRKLDYLQKAHVVKTNQILQIDSFSQTNLELTRTIRSEEKYGSLFWLLDETKTAMGSRLLKNWICKPSSDIQEILRRQNMVESFLSHFMTRNDVRVLLDEIYDLERLIARISYGNANGRDLLQLKNSLKPIPELKTLLTSMQQPEIDELVSKMDAMEDVTQWIEDAISEEAPITIKEGGIFKKGYNADLDELLELSHGGKKWVAELEAKEKERTGIKTMRIGYNKVFGYYIEVSKGQVSQIKEEWGYERKQTTVNGERYITQELKEKEALILNADEKRMNLEYELFLQMRKRIQTKTSIIQKLANQIAQLDVLASLAEVANKYRFVRPTFNFERTIDIRQGRHPVIEKVMKNGSYVPNDVLLDSSTDILLITGPNMGGKSTYMRELAILVVLAQIGSYVPADSANLPIFDAIFTRIGASDDLVSGQSTFMVEMNETNNALRKATDRSLLIFDEIGRGTATFDGMALAQAIIEYITSRIHAKTMFSTHYHELTSLENDIPCLRNVQVCVSEKEEEVTFLYQVQPGAMNKSYGINVARLAHLPGELLDRAKEILLALENKEVHHVENCMTPRPVTEESWIREVKELDPLSMSPMDALNYLYALKKKISEER